MPVLLVKIASISSISSWIVFGNALRLEEKADAGSRRPSIEANPRTQAPGNKAYFATHRQARIRAQKYESCRDRIIIIFLCLVCSSLQE